MPKTVTAEFAAVVLRKHGKKAFTRIRYKRRFFDAASVSYKFDAEFRNLELRDFVDAGEVNLKLDTPFLNRFTQSSVTLVLKNLQNEWIPATVSPSIFAADAVSPIGYDPMQMIFVIEWGYELPDGTRELVALFTGQAINWIFTGRGGSVEVIVSGKEYKMESAEAAQDSDSFSLEATSPALGDSANLIFFTTSKGVGRVDQVRVNGVVQGQGADYEIEDLDEFDKPAKITFSSAPPTGQAVDASGLKWKTNSKIEDRVAALCDIAGITAPERLISPVDFPSGVGGQKEFTSKADWDSGTLADLDSVTEDGSLILSGVGSSAFLTDDFEDGNFSANPVWTVTSGNQWSIQTQFGSLRLVTPTSGLSSTPKKIDTPSAQVDGLWEFDHSTQVPQALTTLIPAFPGGGQASPGMQFKFLFNKTLDEYYILRAQTNAGSSHTFSLHRKKGGVETQLATLSVSLATFAKNSDHKWRITVEHLSGTNAEIKVYFDGALQLTGADSDRITVSEVMEMHAGGNFINAPFGLGGPNVNHFDNFIQIPGTIFVGGNDFAPSGVWESPVIDLGAGNPLSYGALDTFVTIDGDSTILFETRTSNDGIIFDAYVAIAGNNLILSATKQFIQVRATLTRSTGGTDTPHLERLIVNFTVQNVVITLAIHEGRTVFSQIETYASIADFEIGFTGAGIFFFRPKTVTPTPVISINQENAIRDITEYRLGFDDVINVGQVRYGPYFNQFDGATAGEAEPTSERRFGRLIRFENLTGVLLANDVNLAAARARAIYENNFRPRRRIRVKAKMLPQLELGDVVRVSYFDHPLLEKTLFGDPLQVWGGHTPAFGDAENILARDLDFKVIGIRFAPSEATCDLTLQEVLT